MQRRPVRGEGDERLVKGGVVIALVIVAAIFGRGHARVFDRVPIGVGPADVHAFLEQMKFLGVALGIVEGVIVVGVNDVQVVAAHHAHEEILRGRLPRKREAMAVAGGETHAVGLGLVGLVRIVAPETAVGFLEFRHLLGAVTLRTKLAVGLAETLYGEPTSTMMWPLSSNAKDFWSWSRSAGRS